MPGGPRQKNTAIADAPFTLYKRLNIRDSCGSQGGISTTLEIRGSYVFETNKG
jgi:hypothetical protein